MNLEIKEAGTARKIATVSFDADKVSKENQACNEISRVANILGSEKESLAAVMKNSLGLKDELNRKISASL